MRLFKIFVLLLISGIAFGQSGAAMMMTSDGVAVDTFLLDSFPSAAAAYSLRLLDYSQTDSSVIRVRRSSDNAEQDIGFTSEGYLDTAAMKTFVGANSGFIVTWYDQSGNEKDATQSTAVNQPRIINAGTIDRLNGDPCIVSDGSNDFLQSPTGVLGLTTDVLLSCVGAFNVSGQANETVIGISNGSYSSSDQWILLRQNSSNNRWEVIDSSTPKVTNGASDTNEHLWICQYDGGVDIELGIDGSYSTNSTSIPTDVNLTQELDIFAIDNSGSPLLHGEFSAKEFVLWDSDQSANRAAIQSNRNRNYSIY